MENRYKSTTGTDEEDESWIPMSEKRTIYLVTVFIVHTTRFLNRFSALCEQKLAEVHRRMLRLDATLTLLEAKLKSVDCCEGVAGPSSLHAPPDFSSSESVPQAANGAEEPSSESIRTPPESCKTSEPEKNSIISSPNPEQNLQMERNDPRFSRFLRMLRVGVPEQAVKMQMSIEGLDPNLLNLSDATQSPG